MKQILLILAVAAVFLPACNESGDEAPPPETDASEMENSTHTDFEGLTEKEAGALADERELKHRVVEREGQILPTTRDLRQDRLNFVIKGGKVTKISRG